MTAKRASKRNDASPQRALLICLRQAEKLDMVPRTFPGRSSAERYVDRFRFPKGGVRLAGDCVDAFYDVVDALEDDRRIGYEFSGKTIRDRVSDLLLSAVFGETEFDRGEVDAETAWKALLGEFGEKHREASYFVPIVNLELSGVDEVVVGAVKIHANTPSMMERIEASIAELIQGNPRYTEEQQERQLKAILAEIELPPGCCLAEMSLMVHPERGHELAAAAARESVAILRLVALLIERSGVAAVPALLGEVAQAARVQISLIPGQEFHIQGGLVGIGPVQPLKLTRKTMEDLRRELKALGAAVASRLPERGDMQNRISTALRWYSDAIIEPEVSGRFLKFCVALEALLVDRDTEAVGTKLAQSVAVLLAADEESRLANDSLVRDIYKVRSRIAHEGRDMRVPRFLHAVQRIAAASILRVARLAEEEGVKSAGDLTKWVKQRLYE